MSSSSFLIPVTRKRKREADAVLAAAIAAAAVVVDASAPAPAPANDAPCILHKLSALVWYTVFVTTKSFTPNEAMRTLTALLIATGLMAKYVPREKFERARAVFPSVYTLIDNTESISCNVFRSWLGARYPGMRLGESVFDSAAINGRLFFWQAHFVKLAFADWIRQNLHYDARMIFQFTNAPMKIVSKTCDEHKDVIVIEYMNNVDSPVINKQSYVQFFLFGARATYALTNNTPGANFTGAFQFLEKVFSARELLLHADAIQYETGYCRQTESDVRVRYTRRRFEYTLDWSKFTAAHFAPVLSTRGVDFLYSMGQYDYLPFVRLFMKPFFPNINTLAKRYSAFASPSLCAEWTAQLRALWGIFLDMQVVFTVNGTEMMAQPSSGRINRRQADPFCSTYHRLYVAVKSDAERGLLMRGDCNFGMRILFSPKTGFPPDLHVARSKWITIGASNKFWKPFLTLETRQTIRYVGPHRHTTPRAGFAFDGTLEARACWVTMTVEHLQRILKSEPDLRWAQ